MTDAVVLRLERVHKWFRSGDTVVHALNDVSLELRAGEFCAVVGPSGSGKTTLLHIAALLDRPTSGGVWFEGQEVSDLADSARAALRAERIGLIFQRFHLMPHWTALHNVRFRFRYLRHASPDSAARAWRALQAVGLADRAHIRARLLSGGEMQRVAVARALAVPPRLLAADEPTGSLDRAAAAVVMGHLRALCHQGVAVLLATHNEGLLAPADRVYRLENGTVR